MRFFADGVRLAPAVRILPFKNETTHYSPHIRYSPLRSSKQASSWRRLTPDERRISEIQQLCAHYQIEHLVHFTHLANLDSILTEGLLSRTMLESLPVNQQPKFNDLVRADLQKETVSLSISFPNYRMFYRLHKTQSAQWVVLLINPSVLWQLDCAFCTHNAASNTVRKIPLLERKEINSLKQMFADLPNKPRAELRIPQWFPTDPQAEVLIFDKIDPSYITTVNFFDEGALLEWRKTFLPQYPHYPISQFTVNPEFFSRRCDFRHWKSQLVRDKVDGFKIDFSIPF